MARSLAFLLLLAGCPSSAPDPTDDDDATPPPDAVVGCEPQDLDPDDVCEDDQNAHAFSAGTDFCPDFWAGLDLGDGWSSLPARWSLDFAAVTPGEAVDGWAYRNIQSEGEDLSADTPVDVIAAVGDLCSGATDVAGCEAALDALRPTEGFTGGCSQKLCTQDYLVWTRGDAVGAVVDRASMEAFLGSVESEVEALLLVSAAIDGFGWAASSAKDGAIRATEGGYEVLGTAVVWAAAPFRSDVYRLDVRADRLVDILDRALHELDCSIQF